MSSKLSQRPPDYLKHPFKQKHTLVIFGAFNCILNPISINYQLKLDAFQFPSSSTEQQQVFCHLKFLVSETGNSQNFRILKSHYCNLRVLCYKNTTAPFSQQKVLSSSWIFFTQTKILAMLWVCFQFSHQEWLTKNWKKSLDSSVLPPS